MCLSDISVHGTVECFKMKCLRYRIKARKQNNRETKGKLIVAEQKKKQNKNKFKDT